MTAVVSDLRPYDADRDLQAVMRIWREVGWIDASDGQAEALETFLTVGHADVALMDGAAECMVHRTEGSIRYEQSDLALCAITAVTTSRIARKQGFASRLTAKALADGAAEGAEVAALGMFEQGFYDRFGFGTGSYEHGITFDPGSLTVDVAYRAPVRLGTADWPDIHRAMVGRMRSHGSVVLDPPAAVAANLGLIEEPFGLGYRQGERLTHFVFGSAKGEHGPYRISWIGYEDPGQLLELLRLLRELADQVASVKMAEPPELQMQDLIEQPIRQQLRSSRSDHQTSIETLAWLQLRILDVAACVARRHWPGPPVEFNLTLTDPLADRLDGPWRGVGGDYAVSVASQSTVERGQRSGLPTLTATVNAFSRLWFGVRPASSLRYTDALGGPPELLARLDEALRLPPPHPGWDF